MSEDDSDGSSLPTLLVGCALSPEEIKLALEQSEERAKKLARFLESCEPKEVDTFILDSGVSVGVDNIQAALDDCYHGDNPNCKCAVCRPDLPREPYDPTANWDG